MLARACIVLLLVLNLGVALWWAARPPPAPVHGAAVAADVPRLQLLRELPPPARARLHSVADPAVAPTSPATAALPATAAAATQCFSLGPFVTAAAANAARAGLLAQVQRSAVREQRSAPSRDWRVYLPPLPSLQQAQAAAQRLAAAGFSDYMVVRGGDQANSLALGLYGSETSARRRLDALVAAGFPARAEPLGAATTVTWLDIAIAADADAAPLQAQAGAAQRQPLDCAQLP